MYCNNVAWCHCTRFYHEILVHSPPLHRCCAFLSITPHIISHVVIMSYLLSFCQETWSPAHSSTLQPWGGDAQQTEKRSDREFTTHKEKESSRSLLYTDHDSASSGVWSPAADPSAWPGAPASGRRCLSPHRPPAAPAPQHPWLHPSTTCTQMQV